MITDMYAFVSVDPETSNETLIGIRRDDHWQPLITDTSDALDTLRMMARRIGEEQHSEVKLIHFTQREEMPV